MQNGQITILINQRPFHFQTETLAQEEFRQAVDAPDDYEVWHVVHNPDPEGQLPVDDVQITGPTTIHNGERYRVVPPGTFGRATVPAQIEHEVETLRQEGLAIEIRQDDGWVYILLRAYPLPSHFNSATTDLLLKFPISYPNGKPDMFWTDPDVVLRDGRVPKSADSIEPALGRQWRRFSWHPKSWNPATDNLRTYLEFVNRRLTTAE